MKPVRFRSCSWCAAALACLIALTGCSSAPPAPENVTARKNRAVDFTNFGNKYYEEANFSQALEFFQLALETNIAVDNQEGAALSYNSIGKTLLAVGQKEDAEYAYNEAYKIALKLNVPSLIYQSVNNLGEIHLKNGKDQDALKLFTDTLAATKQGEVSKELAILYHGLGVVKRNISEQSSPPNLAGLRESLAHFQKAVEINKKLLLKQELASNYYMMSRDYLSLGELPLAESHANLALENDRATESSEGIGLDLRQLGRIYMLQSRRDEAYDVLLRSYKVFVAVQRKDQQSRTLELIIPLAQEMGKTDEAAYYQKQKDKLDGKS